MATIIKSEKQWQKQLTKEEYYVCRKRGTERAFSGEYTDSKKEGTYTCTCCGEPLFNSDAKFDSGTGWPSFFQPITDAAIGTTEDKKLFMSRTEVHCNNCDSHLGHVFSDGPQPTGLRYCINSVALKINNPAASE